MNIEDKRAVQIKKDKKQSDTKLNLFIAKLKEIKHIKIIAVLLVIAFSLLIYSYVAAGAGEKSAKGQNEELTRILSAIDGIGRVEVYVYDKPVSNAWGETTSGNVVGVIVIAENGEDDNVVNEIKRAIQAVIRVNPYNIQVFGMKR